MQLKLFVFPAVSRDMLQGLALQKVQTGTLAAGLVIWALAGASGSELRVAFQFTARMRGGYQSSFPQAEVLGGGHIAGVANSRAKKKWGGAKLGWQAQIRRQRQEAPAARLGLQSPSISSQQPALTVISMQLGLDSLQALLPTASGILHRHFLVDAFLAKTEFMLLIAFVCARQWNSHPLSATHAIPPILSVTLPQPVTRMDERIQAQRVLWVAASTWKLQIIFTPLLYTQSLCSILSKQGITGRAMSLLHLPKCSFIWGVWINLV